MTMSTDSSAAGFSAPPLVLFEAEATAGGKYDSWQDMTGEQYHFPNQYRKRVVPGRRFVYYRGVRRPGGGRGRAEYFGHGRVGGVWLDEASLLETRKAKWAWFCSIVDYVEFPTPVMAKQNGKHFERIDHSRGWQIGVRILSETAYDDILRIAGIVSPILSPSQPTANLSLRESTGLLRPRRGPRPAVEVVVSESLRRSPRAAEIGRRAETLVFDRLRRQFADVRWLSAEGELPGYDLDYADGGVRHAVEVKGTGGSCFPSVELTINEWRAAERLGDRFWLYLVAGCESSDPVVQIIRNPHALVQSGSAMVSPVVVRIELVASAGVSR